MDLRQGTVFHWGVSTSVGIVRIRVSLSCRVSDFCNPRTCPEMTAGPHYTYLWTDQYTREPVSVSTGTLLHYRCPLATISATCSECMRMSIITIWKSLWSEMQRFIWIRHLSTLGCLSESSDSSQRRRKLPCASYFSSPNREMHWRVD